MIGRRQWIVRVGRGAESIGSIRLGPSLDRLQAGVSGDPVEPGLERAAALESGQGPPGVQQRLLERVLGVLQRAEHPIAVSVQRCTMGSDQLAECVFRRRSGRRRAARLVAVGHRAPSLLRTCSSRARIESPSGPKSNAAANGGWIRSLRPGFPARYRISTGNRGECNRGTIYVGGSHDHRRQEVLATGGNRGIGQALIEEALGETRSGFMPVPAGRSIIQIRA